MVKDKNNLNSYSEEFDINALSELATMAARYVIKEEYNDVLVTNGKTVPDGSFSDFSCNVWELMNSLVRYGIKLEKFRRDERYKERTDLFGLRYPAHLERIDVVRRE